jgi:hypothetical protein
VALRDNAWETAFPRPPALKLSGFLVWNLESGIGVSMLDMRFIRENLDYVTERLSTRGGQMDLAAFQKLDEERRPSPPRSES